MKILIHWYVVSSHIAKYFLIYDVRRHIGTSPSSSVIIIFSPSLDVTLGNRMSHQRTYQINGKQHVTKSMTKKMQGDNMICKRLTNRLFISCKLKESRDKCQNGVKQTVYFRHFDYLVCKLSCEKLTNNEESLNYAFHI